MSWVTVAIAAYGAYNSYSQGKKQADAAKKIGAQQDQLTGIQIDNAKFLQPYMKDYYQRAGQDMAPAESYYKSLASGDYATSMRALSPQMNAIGSKYRSVGQAQAELAPRGGMSASYGAELPYRAADEQTALLNGERSNAYGNLAQMGGQFANMGNAAAGGINTAVTGAGNMTNSSIYSQMALGGGAAGQAASYAKFGNTLADWYKQYSTKNNNSQLADDASAAWGMTGTW